MCQELRAFPHAARSAVCASPPQSFPSMLLLWGIYTFCLLPTSFYTQFSQQIFPSLHVGLFTYNFPSERKGEKLEQENEREPRMTLKKCSTERSSHCHGWLQTQLQLFSGQNRKGNSQLHNSPSIWDKNWLVSQKLNGSWCVNQTGLSTLEVQMRLSQHPVRGHNGKHYKPVDSSV